MQYVSAEWVVVSEAVPPYAIIKAVADNGSVWWVSSIDSDVPPWPQFLETEAGRTFSALPVPSVAQQGN